MYAASELDPYARRMPAPDETVERVTRALDELGASLRGGAWLEGYERALVEDAPGLLVRWSQQTEDQGLRRFGVVASAEEFIRLLDDDPSVVQLTDLHLMLEEPHGTLADAAMRTWYRSVDPFSYRG